MRPLRDSLGRRGGALALVVMLAVVALVATVLLGGGGQRSPTTVRPSPGPVVIGPSRSAPAPVSPGELARARASGRAFLRGYLPFLYGRAPASRVTEVSPAIRAAISRGQARPTPEQRRRRPRIVQLVAVGQGPGSVIVTARIDDGGVAAYPVTFTLSRRSGAWIVTDLGND